MAEGSHKTQGSGSSHRPLPRTVNRCKGPRDVKHCEISTVDHRSSSNVSFAMTTSPLYTSPRMHVVRSAVDALLDLESLDQGVEHRRSEARVIEVLRLVHEI